MKRLWFIPFAALLWLSAGVVEAGPAKAPLQLAQMSGGQMFPGPGTAHSSAAAPLSRDGHNAVFTAGGTTSQAVITTTLANTIIVATGTSHSNTSTIRTVSTVTDNSGQGLTWAKRSGQSGVDGTSNGHDQEMWWANLPSAATVTVTVTWSGAVDTSSLFIIGVNGAANTASPWDANVSLPGLTQNLPSSSVDVTQTISTTAPHTFIISAWVSNSNIAGSIPFTAPTSFTNSDQVTGSNSSTFNDGQLAYFITASAQASLAVDWNAFVQRWQYTVDAIQGN